jgi:hypothetical protein
MIGAQDAGARAVRLTMMLATLLPVVLAGAPAALAQAGPGKAVDSLACRRQCGAVSSDRAQNPPDIQACLIRCGAGQRHLSRQNQRGTPEASGRGEAAGTGLVAGVPSIWPPRASGPDASTAAGRALVAYAATPPARGFAISMPIERMAAHRGAETECYRVNNNAPCRLLTETRERCLAVSVGVRANGLTITSDPRTYTVTRFATGAGSDRGAAEAVALRDCGMRPLPGTQCRIAAVRCQN